jgi:Predicted sulfurtransferase
MFEVVGFYKFIKISYLKKNKKVLFKTLKKKNIRGTIIISKEGLNGTISGKASDLKFTIENLKRTLKFKDFNSSNTSKSSFQPFHKPKVKIKNEVVPMNFILNKRIKKKR